ncbi:unnamed protein product [Closterium sp. NIES-64]|nr:unnamed protein product [Closterium sp. NIES-64]
MAAEPHGRYLFAGDVEGRLNLLFKRAAAVNKSNGPFDCLFCVGAFFPPSDPATAAAGGAGGQSELEDYIAGRAKAPLPTFLIGDIGVGAQRLLEIAVRGGGGAATRKEGEAAEEKVKEEGKEEQKEEAEEGGKGEGEEKGEGEDKGEGEEKGEGEDKGEGEEKGEGEDKGEGEEKGEGEDKGEGEEKGEGEDKGEGEEKGEGEDKGEGEEKRKGKRHGRGRGMEAKRSVKQGKGRRARGRLGRARKEGGQGEARKRRMRRYDPATYLSGQAGGTGVAEGRQERAAVEALVDAGADGAAIDVLLTNEWPKGVAALTHPSLLPSPPPATSASAPASVDWAGVGSPVAATLAKELMPRYHVAGGAGAFFARPPYINSSAATSAEDASTSASGPVTRFIDLPKGVCFDLVRRGSCTRGDTCRFAHSLPSTSPGLLATPPPLTPASLAALLAPPAAGGPAGGATGGAGGAGGAAPPTPAPCWFCLASPKVETHLVVSVGEHCYVALPKGPLVPGHVLILPIEHFPSVISLPSDALAEMWRYMGALRKCFEAQGQTVVAFERFLQLRAATHAHVNVVPIPQGKADQVLPAFTAAAASHNFQFASVPKPPGLSFLLAPPCLPPRTSVPPSSHLRASFLAPPCLLPRTSVPPSSHLRASFLAPPCLLPRTSVPPSSHLRASFLAPPCLLTSSPLPTPGSTPSPLHTPDGQHMAVVDEVKKQSRGGQYLTVELPDASLLVHAIDRGAKLPMQLGREVRGGWASGETRAGERCCAGGEEVVAGVVGVPERGDWRACKETAEEEAAMADAFKKQFQPFDIMG